MGLAHFLPCRPGNSVFCGCRGRGRSVISRHCFTVLLARFYIWFLFQRISHAIIFCIVGSTSDNSVICHSLTGVFLWTGLHRKQFKSKLSSYSYIIVSLETSYHCLLCMQSSKFGKYLLELCHDQKCVFSLLTFCLTAWLLG